MVNRTDRVAGEEQEDIKLLRSRFSEPLLSWYERNKRDLPWRRSRDPYHIWVSEIMLQQTRVETVIPYYERFISRFPTIADLAEADEDEVLKMWEGLGYYSRARNLQAAAREVQAEYGGRVPDSKEEIASLKGVGPYTAGAILSIAYNKPEPAVDGNVMRVLSRFLLMEDDIAKPSSRKKFEEMAAALIPEGAAGDFNQALMDLGASICTPKSPACLLCPVMEHCRGRLAGRAEELPIKTKGKPPRPEWRAVALVEGTGDKAGQVLIRQRPGSGLLARMWELPHVPIPESAYGADGEPDPRAAGTAMTLLAEELAREDGVTVIPGGWLMQESHLFSHIHWNLDVYRCRLASPPGSGRAGRTEALPPGYRFIGASGLESVAMPNVFLRILRAYWRL